MSRYTKGEALLGEALLRRNALPGRKAILVVEGPDDRRILAPRCILPHQVVPAGGRAVLIQAHAYATERAIPGVVFVVDCDYDVPLGRLSGKPDLIITSNADAEADLVALGLLSRIVGDVVPDALSSDEQLTRTTTEALQRAVAIAEPIGRMRLVSREDQFPINLKDLRFGRIVAEDGSVDIERLVDVIVSRSEECPLPRDQYLARINQAEQRFQNCNGHDLLAAIAFVLKSVFKVQDCSSEHLTSLLRLALDDRAWETWSISERLKRWESDSGYELLIRSVPEL